MTLSYSVVIPTLGRPSLQTCLRALADGSGPAARQIVVVDDRPPPAGGSPLPVPEELADRTLVLTSGGAGPAAARNVGWQAADTEWIAFLDDDTVPGPTWARDLAADLARAEFDVAGVQGRISVPLPAGRPPTDWERGTAGLADALWITADMAYRRTALEEVHGFDERFRRAYREDADIAIRMIDAGWYLEKGQRTTVHPVRPADFWASVRAQAGNSDDVLMRRLHGPDWRLRCGAPPGRLARHLAVTAAAAACAASVGLRAKRTAAVTAALWLAGVGEFAWARIRSGPRDRREITTMTVTSALIPFMATAHRVRGLLAHRGARPWPDSHGSARSWTSREEEDGLNRLPRVTRSTMETAATVQEDIGVRPPASKSASASDGTGGPWVFLRESAETRPDPPLTADVPSAVLFDRDGTLVDDVPYNGDPDAVRLRPGAAEAVRTLRKHGIAVGVVTNQSGVARGLLTRSQVEAVNRRVDELVGPLDVWVVCPHGPDDVCRCRKPAPGLVLAAADALGVDPSTVVVVGDIGADMLAAESAGARGILVPNAATLPQESALALCKARDLVEATSLLTPE
jgi:HAD superfamily hydrolase (TIGR01662 family)